MARLIRTNFLVNRTFQFKILGVSLLFSIPIIIVFFVGHLVFVNSLFDFGQNLDIESSRSFYEFIAEQSFKIRSIFVFSIVSILSLNLLFFFILSHSIAGPIEKIKNLLKAKAAGEPVKAIEFRDNDFFSELAPLLNEALGLPPERRKLTIDKPENPSTHVNKTE